MLWMEVIKKRPGIGRFSEFFRASLQNEKDKPELCEKLIQKKQNYLK